MRNLLVLVVILSSTLISGCQSAAVTDVKAAGKDMVDCMKVDITARAKSAGLSVLAEVAAIILHGGQGWQDELTKLGGEFGQDALACATKAVAQVLNPTTNTPSTQSNPAAARALEALRTGGWSFK